MVGLIQKLLIDMVESMAGEEGVSEVKRQAQIPADHQYKLNEVYSDEEWRRLFASARAVLKVSEEQAEEAFADFFLADSQARFPMWFKMAKNAREFLERQPAIHNNFATGVEDTDRRQAITDKFVVESDNESLVTHYSSPNRLCGLYIVLTHKVLDLFNEQAEVQEVACMKRGDKECEIHIRWN